MLTVTICDTPFFIVFYLVRKKVLAKTQEIDSTALRGEDLQWETPLPGGAQGSLQFPRWALQTLPDSAASFLLFQWS